MNEDMSPRDRIIAERAEANMAEFWDHGPGLRLTTRSWVIARGDGMVLLGGLGGMGQGVMWVEDSPHSQADSTYEDAPYEPDRSDDFGATGRARDANRPPPRSSLNGEPE